MVPLFLAGALVAVFAQPARPPAARFMRHVEWAGAGFWLAADLHTHTRFSDGRHPVDRVVAKAAEHGCDVVAITDHADQKLEAATVAYHEAIDAARAAYPGLLVLAGLEWNIHPGGGNDHATVLVPPHGEAATLVEFKRRFDDYKRLPDAPAEPAAAGFGWLAGQETPAGVRPVVFLNHPSRRLESPVDLLARLEPWRDPDGLVGFEGAPGYQAQKAVGAYVRAVKPIDRWDPVVAEIGGVWDQLLQRGETWWGALANSDFHATGASYWPCEFSRTLVHAPDRSPEGVLRALRAGSFVGTHGGLVARAELTARVPGLARPAIAGEVVATAAGSRVTVGLAVSMRERDWAGGDARIDELEVIGIDDAGARSLHRSVPGHGGQVDVDITVPAGGIVVRGRGRRIEEDGSSLWFYTNPIRISTP